MRRLIEWVWQTIVFYLKAAIFLGVLLLLFIFGVVHALVAGGPIMPDDAWFLAKTIFLLFVPLIAWIALKRKAALALGIGASLLLAGFMSWGNYVHAPSFWEAKSYSIENGKLIVPEGKRDELLRDCGLIEHEGLRNSCEAIVYCQSYDEGAYQRVGCEELLRKKTSPALLDMAIQERKIFEEDQRKKGE